ncbi:MAG: hypothetical protein ABSE73_04365 [Planctomycetota bacterium]
MSSKKPWIVAVVAGVGLFFCLIGLGNADKARKRAEAELAEANNAKAAAQSHADQAAKAQKTTEAELAKARENLPRMLGQVKELEEQKVNLQQSRAKLESYLTTTQLAEAGAAKPQPETEEGELPAAPPPQPGEWSVPPLLPPDALFVATLRDAKQAIDRFKQNGLWQIWSNPDVQHVFRAPLNFARATILFAEVQQDFKFDTLLDFVSQGEITFAVLGVDKKREQGQPLPDLLLAVQPRNTAEALVNEVAKRLDALSAAAGEKLVVTKNPQGNTVVNTVTLTWPGLPQGQVRLQYALCDGTLVATLGDGRLDRLLAMHDKYKTEQPKAVEAGQAPEVLSQVPAYQKALEKAGPDASLLAFLNVEGLLKNPILEIKPKDEQQRLEWEALGLENIAAISYCASIRRKGVREATFINMPLERRKGVLGLFEGEGVGLEALAAAPRSSILALALKTSPERLLDKIVDLATLENPTAKQDIATALAAVGQGLNMDLRKEVLGAFTGQAVFSVSLNARHPKLPVSFPQPILALGIKDLNSLKNLLRALRDSFRDTWDFTDLTVGDREIVVARERAAEGREPGQLALAIDRDNLLISLYPLALRAELARRGAAGTGVTDKDAALGTLKSSLAADKDFQAASKRLKAAPQALVYLDTGALAVAAYDVFMPVVQLRVRNPQVDVAALPASDILLQNLGGTVLGFSSDKDGVIAEAYSPAGAVSLLALAPAVALGRPLAARQVGRQVNKQQQAFEELGRKLKAYAQDNGGKFPARLKDLQPKYIPDPTPELDMVEYRGPQDAGNKIVAHSSEKLRGPITVLTQDGTVTSLPRLLLGKALQEGLQPNLAAPPGPAGPGQKAAKPPKPPTDF